MREVLLITGSMGAGKTATLGEASDLLAERGIAHAAIDLDALAVAHFPDRSPAAVEMNNLASVVENYASSDISRFVLAAAVESRGDLERIRRATAASSVVICRLRAPLATMEARVAARERGIRAARYIARVRVLGRILEEAALEDFSIETGGLAVTEVARQLLQRAGWI